MHFYVYWLQKEIEQWLKNVNQRKENISMQSCIYQGIKIPIYALVNILPFFFLLNEPMFKTYVIYNVDVKPQKVTLKASIILWHAFFFSHGTE